MLNVLLLCVSVTAGVTVNGLQNKFGKSECKNQKDINCYNMITFFVCMSVFAAVAILNGKISLFTVIMGLAFGVFTFTSSYCKLVALSRGPMHVTNLIITTSMLIPTLSGPILFPESEKFSIPKLIFAAVLMFFIYLLAKKDEKETSVKKGWIPMMAVAFLGSGFIGVMQKVHQSSEHKDEIFAFLAVSFAFSFAVSLFTSRGNACREYFKSSTYLAAIICGAGTFAMHFINMKLSGEIPTQIFFPAVNGASIIGTTLLAVFGFKERVTARQIIGMVGGFLCLLAIVLV